MDMGLTPQATALKLLKLVSSLAHTNKPLASADRMQLLTVLDLALQAPRLGNHLIDAIIDQHVKDDAVGGKLIQEHRDNATWSRPYPLGIQQYSPLFKDGPMLHLGLLGALQQSAWPRVELTRLRNLVGAGDDAHEAAQVLVKDFQAIASEATQVVVQLLNIKELRASSSIHVVQIEAYLAATAVEGSLAGHNCIDLGSGGGELVSFLQQQGAWACGSELDPPGPGLFGVAEEPKFDVVFATGFMEPGAFSWPDVGMSVSAYNDRVDDLITTAAKLLKPRGILVVRNVNFPLMFTARALKESGLTQEPVRLPFCTPSFGGRLAVWRKAVKA